MANTSVTGAVVGGCGAGVVGATATGSADGFGGSGVTFGVGRVLAGLRGSTAEGGTGGSVNSSGRARSVGVAGGGVGHSKLGRSDSGESLGQTSGVASDFGPKPSGGASCSDT